MKCEHRKNVFAFRRFRKDEQNRSLLKRKDETCEQFKSQKGGMEFDES